MKSSSSVGPRSPALSEFWLSAIGTPWFVVSTRSPESTRTRSSEPIVSFEPTGGVPLPVLSDAFSSVTVLPVTSGSRGFAVGPGAGRSAASGSNSRGLLALYGKADASSSVPAIFAARVGAVTRVGRGFRRPADRAARLGIRFDCFLAVFLGRSGRLSFAGDFAMMPRGCNFRARDARIISAAVSSEEDPHERSQPPDIHPERCRGRRRRCLASVRCVRRDGRLIAGSRRRRQPAHSRRPDRLRRTRQRRSPRARCASARSSSRSATWTTSRR